MTEVLVGALMCLAEKRAELSIEQAAVKELETEIAASPQGQRLAQLRENAARVRAECDLADAKVRELALTIYRMEGRKQAVEGVTVKVRKLLDYQAAEATEWARANAPALLVLDHQAFQKAAPSMHGAPVVMREEPTVAIARDLSQWLEVAEVTPQPTAVTAAQIAVPIPD